MPKQPKPQPPSTNNLVSAIAEARQRARTDPNWFAEEVLRLKALPGEPSPGEAGFSWQASWVKDEWQRELSDTFADVLRKRDGLPTLHNHEGKNMITVRAPQGPGKTFGIAELSHWWGFCFYPSIVVVTAPKLDHVKTRFFGEFQKIRARAIPGYSRLMDVQATRVYWASNDPDNHLLVAETGRQPENMQGLRRQHTLVLVDEASGVDEKLIPVLLGNLAGVDLGIFGMIANPTRNIGTFAASHLSPALSADYHRMHISLPKANRISRDWVGKMIRQYGENSPVVKIRCFGEFATDDKNQLIAMQWIAAAMEREFEQDGSLPRLRVSVDVADGGEDETVVTVAQHHNSHVRALKQAAFSFSSDKASVDGADAAERMFIAHGGRKEIDDFVVDSVGVGTGVAGVLVSRGYKVVRYKGGSDSDNSKMWRNRRVQSYMVLRDALRDGRISFADDFTEDSIELQAQLCSIRSKPGTERLEDLFTREEMRAAGIASPDRADSLAMQYATQAPVLARPPADAPARMKVIRSTLLEGLLP